MKIIIFLLILSGCSYNPVIDSRGKSSANINGTAERLHDDLYTCKDIADDNTNAFINGSKVTYNALRWRVLWLSPKLPTKKNLIDNCLEGRGHNVLSKD